MHPSSPTDGARPRTASRLLLFAFFVSGICGLVHEVTWTRLLRHVMGNTTFAVTTVLTVFMAGLALGSLIAGRVIERRTDPVRVFALLEGAIGVTCLVLPWAIDALEPLYGALYRATGGSFALLSLARFLFCGIVLLPTATMMGATLPVLVRFFVGSTGAVGLSIGRLYAINTLGAVVGVAGSGFVLLPVLGVTRTIWLASALNVAICALGLRLHARLGTVAPAPTPAPRGPEREVELSEAGFRVALVAYGCAGFSSLAYEVAWTRVLSSMIGSSVYAFAMMLTAFIVGLGLGSLAFARRADRVGDPLRALALLQIGVALSALLVVPLFGSLPVTVTALISRQSGSFWSLQASEFGLLVAIMLVPTLLMGAAFPLVSRFYAARSHQVARSVGAAYSANTVGSILGSAAAGFLLLPAIGAQATIYVAVVINGLVAAAFALLSRRWRGAGRGAAVAAPAALAACAALLPAWNPAMMYFGSFFMARVQPAEVARSGERMREMVRKDEILFHEEGIDTTVTVRRNPLGELALLVNGKPDASSVGDMPTQMLLAHVPLLLHPEPEDVLVIGLASGVTLGSAARHPVGRLDCAEISSSVVRACELFSPYNHDVLSDPRVNVLVVDGRNHLALSGKRYDVIVSEPSNPWIIGVADLFTLEFFELCREALTERGVACIWFERYTMDERSFLSVVRTFREVFPSATLWNPNHADYLLVGAKDELAVDAGRLAERIREGEVAEDLARIDVHDASSFLSHYLMGPEALSRLGEGAPLHTDDNALLEFATPRAMVAGVGHSQVFGRIEEHRDPDLRFLRAADPAVLSEARREALRAIEARALSRAAERDAELGRSSSAREKLTAAARLNPSDRLVQAEIGRGLPLCYMLLQRGELGEAVSALETLLSLDPSHAGTNAAMGLALTALGHCDRALDHLRLAVEAGAPDDSAVEALAFLLACHPSAARRDPERALELARQVAARQSGQAIALRTLAAAHAANGRFQDALRILSEAEDVARREGRQPLLPMLASMRECYGKEQLFLRRCY